MRHVVLTLAVFLLVTTAVQSVLALPVTEVPSLDGNQNAPQGPPDDRPLPGKVLPALARRPIIDVRLSNGRPLSLPLEVSTIAITRGANHTFLERLTPDLLNETDEWFVVLRGKDANVGATAAVIIRPNLVDVIINLPTGASIRVSRPGTDNPSQPLASAPSSDKNPQLLAAPPFFLSEVSPFLSSSDDAKALILTNSAVGNADHQNSIRVSKHIWQPDHSEATDPVNVIFYHKANLLESLLGDIGWVDGGAGCGSAKDLKFYDSGHGGQDAWRGLATHWVPSGSWCAGWDRFHGREYRSDTGDTHSPGFGSYRPFPVHWENWLHGTLGEIIDPQYGQDKLLADLSGHSNIGDIWLTHIVPINDCKYCDRWDGWFDIYQITDGAANACADERLDFLSFGGSVTSVAWECGSFPIDTGTFPIRDYALCKNPPNHEAASGLGIVEWLDPDQSYFYYTSATRTWGYDKDQDSAHTVVAQVAGRERADLYQVGWDGDGSFEVESSLAFDYVDVDFNGLETRVVVVAWFRTARADAGQWAAIRMYCFGTNMPTDEVRYHVWLTKNDLTIGTNRITVRFDPYAPSDGYFSSYEVYYREDGQSTWNIGGSSTSQSTSSITVQNLDCTKTYHFKARVIWNGQYWTNGFSDSHVASDQPSCGGGGGGSPFVAPWNGTAYQPDNNILPLSEVFDRESLDVDDYYRLHAPLLSRDGTYSLKLVEFEDERSFFDSVALWTVDHDPDTRIGVHPQTGEILTYESPEQPASAVDNYGRDVLGALTAWDGAIYEGWRGDYVELNFADVPRENARLVIVADVPLLKTRIYVHVWNGTDWELADTMHHRMNFAEDVIDLSRFVPTQDDLRVRLLAASHFALEQVGLDTSPPKTVSVLNAVLLNAAHSSGTDVTGLLSHPDASYGELVPGEEILLTFEIPTTGDEARSYIFVSRGHYVHKYQPLQGTEVNADNLSVFFESVIPEAPLGQFWEVEIVRLGWDMGDGTLATGRTVSHLYAQAGEYRIGVRIEYSDGTAKFYERVILVFA